MADLRARPWLDRLLPLALLILALVVRLWALGWGLPYVEHPDEPALVEVTLRMLQRGDANPGFFLYPSLYFYMLAVVAAAHVAWGVAAGLYSSLQAISSETYLYTQTPQLYLWLRTLTATMGAVSVPLLYLLGRRMYGLRAGLLAGLALALSGYHVEHSHFITADVPAGFFTTLALLGCWAAASDGRWRSYLLAGAASGLAAGTKYNAGVVGLALAAACVVFCLRLRETGRAGEKGLIVSQVIRLCVAGLVAILVFLLTTPYALLDWPAFLRGMQINADHYASGSHGDFIGRWRLDAYLAFLWREGLGWAASLLLAAGLPLLLRRTPAPTAVLLVATLALGGLLLTQAVNFTRNAIPLLPVLFLLAAAGAVALADWAGRWLARNAGVEGPQVIDLRPDGPPSPGERQRAAVAARRGGLILALLGLALLAPLADRTLWLLGYWSQPHTLVRVAERLQDEPRGMLAAVEMNPVQWAGDPAVEPMRWLGGRSPDWYRARGYRYLVLNSERYAPEDQAAYQQLLDGANVIEALPDRDLGLMPGPGAALLDLGEYAELIPFVRRPASFGDQIALLGYELRPGELRARISPLEGADERGLASGQPVQINLYWRALAAPASDYTLFLHLYNAAGERVAQRDLPPRHADYPPSRWRPGELVIDMADMPLPALPPGEYRIEIGLYDAATGAALPASEGPVTLTTLTIR